MIFPDANLLLYAEDALSRHHEISRNWWDGCLSGTDRVNLSWQVVNAFIRISTNPRLHARPLTLEESIDRVGSWFSQPNVHIVSPTEHHWLLFQQQMIESGATGNLVSDAHLAALAIEHASTLYSSDVDFARFPSLRWKNPIKS